MCEHICVYVRMSINTVFGKTWQKFIASSLMKGSTFSIYFFSMRDKHCCQIHVPSIHDTEHLGTWFISKR